MPAPISDRRRFLEALFVLVTAAGKFVFMDLLHWRFPFIVCTTVGWAVYIYFRWKNDPTLLVYWGFRTDNLRAMFFRLMPIAAVALISCLIIGYTRATLQVTWHIIPGLVLYPIWGTVQQFLCVGLVTGNLQDMRRPVPKILNVLITAVLFSALHYPNLWLMAGTFVLAILYSIVYLRERNLYALGLFHGWLGVIFYYSVVGRDPFAEVFG
jgi:membrane protease YdiL (CAAX protease family)